MDRNSFQGEKVVAYSDNMFDSTDDVMLCAAYLAGQEQRPQTEIAQQLKISQAAVSRLLHRARQEQVLVEKVNFASDKVDPDTLVRIRRKLQSSLAGDLQALSARAGTTAPVVRVFPSGSKSDKDLERRLATYSERAAPYLKAQIAEANSCGVTWGNTLIHVVDALQNIAGAAPWRTDGKLISFLPLSGEPFGKMPAGQSSSTMVERLGHFANGKSHKSLSIGNVPAFIPGEDEGFSRADLRGVRKLIQKVEAYGTIFGASETQPGVVDSVEMILTSVGPANKPWGFGDSDRLLGGVSAGQLERLLAGDVGGVGIPRVGLKSSDDQTIRDINDRWTGVKRQHLEKCVRLAAKPSSAGKRSPGVVVVAVGAYKAKIVLTAIKLGLINELVIDDDLEEALTNEVRVELSKQ